MASRAETFVAPGVRLEWQPDRWNGWRVNAWRPHASMTFTDRQALLGFLNLPPKTPTGDLIRGWLDSLIATVPAEPQALEPEQADALAELSAELLAKGFGPECHGEGLDPSDPNYASRTVI